MAFCQSVLVGSGCFEIIAGEGSAAVNRQAGGVHDVVGDQIVPTASDYNGRGLFRRLATFNNRAGGHATAHRIGQTNPAEPEIQDLAICDRYIAAFSDIDRVACIVFSRRRPMDSGFSPRISIPVIMGSR